MKKQKIYLSFVLVVIFLIFLFFIPQKHNLEDIKQVKIAGQSIKVELAITSAEQAQGLSGKSGLKEDEGMLFVFERPDKYDFWMKDMNFPIDIIWLSEDLKIIYIKKDARPELYPEIYGPDISKAKAKYILEVVSGFSEKNNLKEGDWVKFLYK